MGIITNIYKCDYNDGSKKYLNNTQLFNMTKDIINRISISNYLKIEDLREEMKKIYIENEKAGGVTYSQYLQLCNFLDTCIEVKKENEEMEKREIQLCSESVRHFASSTIHDLDDEGRYFYNDVEFNRFLDEYKKKTGDIELKKIHHGIVYDDINKDKFYCYEVVHQSVWDKYKNNKNICQARE